MATLLNSVQANLPEANFKEKVRCGEVYRNLNGNEMFQKFYYRCSECSVDFDSSTEFEEHVIAHYLQDDGECTAIDNSKNNENIISISSDEDDEEENGYLYAFEVASLVEENVSENDLPLPLMQMLSEHSADSCDQIQLSEESDDDEGHNVVFPCEGLRKQALHQYSEYCCPQCPAYFNTRNELNLHLHIHTLPNTVQCPHCYEAFMNIIKLNEHISLKKKKRLRTSKARETKCESDIYQNCKRPREDDLQHNSVREEGQENINRIGLKEMKDISEAIEDRLDSCEKTGEIDPMNDSLNCEVNKSNDINTNLLNDT